jgi:hypothetical protein
MKIDSTVYLMMVVFGWSENPAGTLFRLICGERKILFRLKKKQVKKYGL